jgi:hypothetical protein
MDIIYMLMGSKSEFNLVFGILIKNENVGHLDIQSSLRNLDFLMLLFPYWG